MISNLLGSAALFFSICYLIIGILMSSQELNTSSVERNCVLWFIAAVICFK